MAVAVVVCDVDQLDRWHEQKVFVKARLIRHPCKNDEMGGRRRPKARRAHIHSRAEATLINFDCLDLKPYHPSAVEVHHGQLGRLEVWKRAEKVQAHRLAEAADHLRLAKSTQVTPPLRTNFRECFFDPVQWSSEAFSQPLKRN